MSYTPSSRPPRRPFGPRPAFAQKPRTYLGGDFARDMKELRILGDFKHPQTRLPYHKDETPQFIAYLTLALQNISELLGKNKKGEMFDISRVEDIDRKTGKNGVGANTIVKMLESSGKLYEVASFLWLHRAENPGRDYPDYAEKAKAVVVKLWELRNMFVHSTQAKASKVLVVEPEFYRFVDGELFSESRMEKALGPGRKSEKAFKPLFVPNNDAKTKYEFTRRGMIFLVCLALYRHDAAEFLQQFPDMQLPPLEWQMEQGIVTRPSEEELVALRKKGGSVKAILDAFTYYSMRSSRTDINVADKDYLNFANILLYLNKVPAAAYSYLSLDAEAKRLADAAAGSNESEKNRRFKYVLQERKKDRFLTLALAWIEDFGKLECIRFKRLDVTVRPERSKFKFGPIPEGSRNERGEDISDANGMDRHYVVGGGVAQFEFEPKEHSGPVRISALRGGIGENEIMRLLLVLHDNGVWRRDPNAVLGEYLAAYHRILERMLNAKNTDELTLDDPQFRRDFNAVRGRDPDAELPKETFVEDMKPFFSPSVTRFFAGTDLRPDVDQLQSRLRSRLSSLSDRAGDFLRKLDRLTEWKKLDESEKERRGKPSFAIGELRFPPRTCKFTDAQLIRWVLLYLNANLSQADKFRQLPRAMRHRGAKDFEFQLLHADIGKFGTNPAGLWKTLEKRDSLNAPGGALELLRDREGELFREEQRRCRGKFDKNGRPLRPGHTLTMLACAAAELYADACAGMVDLYCGPLSEEDAAVLPFVCRTFGVRTGQPLDRDALVKTVLGIDLASWSKAFDYEAKAPRQTPRSLEEAKKLVASQIPVPNDIARRCVKEETKFNPAFRAFDPWGGGKMRLRSFYGVSPLLEMVERHDAERKGARAAAREEHFWANDDLFPYAGAGIETRVRPEEAPTLENGEPAPTEPGKTPPRHRPSFLRGDINKAIQDILLAERQDKVLLACAREYWDRYMGDEVQTVEKKKTQEQKAKIAENFRFSDAADVWEFFRMSMDDTVGDVTVRVMPNDFARPAYGTVLAHLPELVKKTNPLPETQGVYAFYDLWLSLRDLQRWESSLRLNLVPATTKFDVLVDAPHNLPGGLDELFLHCRKALQVINAQPLTREEFDAILELGNRLRHPPKDGVSLSTMEEVRLPRACAALRRFGCLKGK